MNRALEIAQKAARVGVSILTGQYPVTVFKMVFTYGNVNGASTSDPIVSSKDYFRTLAYCVRAARDVSEPAADRVFHGGTVAVAASTRLTAAFYALSLLQEYGGPALEKIRYSIPAFSFQQDGAQSPRTPLPLNKSR